MNNEDFPTDVDSNLYDGCAIECTENEFLFVDPRGSGSWKCIEKLGPMPMWCPGQFNTGNFHLLSSLICFLLLMNTHLKECGCDEGPEMCPIGECECDGQLRVSHDCKEAK